MIDTFSNPRENELLAAIPDAEWQRLLPLLEWVDMPLGQVLSDSGRLPNYVYFPTDAVVSLQYATETGAFAEVAVVGRDGVVGVSLFMGGESTPGRAVVQRAGQGFRLKALAIKSEFNQAGPVMNLLLRYTQSLITRIAQAAACRWNPSLDQQLCRWLLLALDRLQGSEVVITEELIGNMRGEGCASEAASVRVLPKRDALYGGHDCISALDLKGLEKRTRDCYAAVRKEYGQLLSMPLAA